MFACAPSATPSLGRRHTLVSLLGRPAARPPGKKGLHREGAGPLLLCFGNRLHQIGEGAAAPGRSGNRRAWINTATHASIRDEGGSLRPMLRSARGERKERVASGLSLPPRALDVAGAAAVRDPAGNQAPHALAVRDFAAGHAAAGTATTRPRGLRGLRRTGSRRGTRRPMPSPSGIPPLRGLPPRALKTAGAAVARDLARGAVVRIETGCEMQWGLGGASGCVRRVSGCGGGGIRAKGWGHVVIRWAPPWL
jgi:hypothetical protein